MTVGDLIRELQKFDPKLDVVDRDEYEVTGATLVDEDRKSLLTGNPIHSKWVQIV